MHHAMSACLWVSRKETEMEAALKSIAGAATSIALRSGVHMLIGKVE